MGNSLAGTGTGRPASQPASPKEKKRLEDGRETHTQREREPDREIQMRGVYGGLWMDGLDE